MTKPHIRGTEVPNPAFSKGKRDFFQDVMDVVRCVPMGRVTSYGAIAKYLGAARSARIVGYCMNKCHTQQPPIPAQRVVNRSGLLTGKHHFASPSNMQALLEAEGVEVMDDKVVRFHELFWDPMVELDPQPAPKR